MLPVSSFKNRFRIFPKCLTPVLFFCFLFLYAKPCDAQEIQVKLIWKFNDVGWFAVHIEEGSYRVKGLEPNENDFPAGSEFDCAWGGLSPIVRVNDQPFTVWRGVQLDLIAQDTVGVFKIQTPDGKTVRYRGSLQIEWAGDHWSLMNKIDREEYLKGVVPMEMSNAWARDGLEALKAQAIAARTFVVKKLQTQPQITDSPDKDQAYLGKDAEGEATWAVYATDGEILADAQTKTPIDALYSSHNGGYTEKAENVWQNADPHYSSHPDPFSVGIGGPADRWRFIIGGDILGKTFLLGPIQSVQLEKFPSGRVKKVRLLDQFGNRQEMSGRAFVQAFYPFGHPIETTSFLGSLFDVQKVSSAQPARIKLPPYITPLSFHTFESQTDEEKTSVSLGPRLDRILSSSLGVREQSSPYPTFIFQGRGWGHGVGMSQWGAYHMAQLGYNYREILNFYYDCMTVFKIS